MKAENLLLIDPRGSGKSAIGHRVALTLGVPFCDGDEELERRARRSISDFFADGDVEGFRAMEQQVHLHLIADQPGIIATGGGCVLSPHVRAALMEHPAVVLLMADPETLGQRIGGSSRPSLTGADPAREVKVILDERRPLYEQCATRTVDTTTCSIEEVTHAIEQLWLELVHHDLR